MITALTPDDMAEVLAKYKGATFTQNPAGGDCGWISAISPDGRELASIFIRKRAHEGYAASFNQATDSVPSSFTALDAVDNLLARRGTDLQRRVGEAELEYRSHQKSVHAMLGEEK